MCHDWKNTKFLEDGKTHFLRVLGWRSTTGATIVHSLFVLQLWLGWWQFCCRQWGQWMQEEMTIVEDATMPTTNLREVVHLSWWILVCNGEKWKTNLFATTNHDKACAIIQQSKFRYFTEEELFGMRPYEVELHLCVAHQLEDPKKMSSA